MGTRDPRVDVYIAKSADFAKPILTYIRDVVHDACPEVEETLKWSSPSFEYKGLLCGMAAFKAHATFGFWKHPLVTGAQREKGSMGFSRLTKVSDLPSKKVLTGYVRKAMALKSVRDKLAALGGEPMAMAPAEWDRFLHAEIAMNAELVKAAGIKPNP